MGIISGLYSFIPSNLLRLGGPFEGDYGGYIGFRALSLFFVFLFLCLYCCNFYLVRFAEVRGSKEVSVSWAVVSGLGFFKVD